MARSRRDFQVRSLRGEFLVRHCDTAHVSAGTHPLLEVIQGLVQDVLCYAEYRVLNPGDAASAVEDAAGMYLDDVEAWIDEDKEEAWAASLLKSLDKKLAEGASEEYDDGGLKGWCEGCSDRCLRKCCCRN